MLQHLPDGEDGRERIHTQLDHPEWDHVASRGISVDSRELTDSNLPLEELIWRLFHDEDEVRLLSEAQLGKGCRCDAAHIASVISRCPEDERQEMADASGIINVNCEFCARTFPINAR